jgi:hypothetical protein
MIKLIDEIGCKIFTAFVKDDERWDECVGGWILYWIIFFSILIPVTLIILPIAEALDPCSK